MGTVLTDDFACCLAKEFVLRLFDKFSVKISEHEWASVFARCIGADWSSSECEWSVTRQDGIAWCAKIIANCQPHKVKHVVLEFNGFDVDNVHTEEANQLGEMILGAWNARIAEVRKQFVTTRTVVLIKGDDLSTVSVFEEEALKFLPEEYEWDWNQEDNLEGYVKGTGVKRFTWQPHVSRFSITTNVPDNRLKICIRRPSLVDRDEVLTQLKFDPSWIEIVA